MSTPARRAAAPSTSHASRRPDPAPGVERARPSVRRIESTSWSTGSSRPTTSASPSVRRVSAVASCSPKGRSSGVTTTWASAAARSAIELCPAAVITTSARHNSSHGSATQRPPGPPSEIHSTSPSSPGTASQRASWPAPPEPRRCRILGRPPPRAPGSGARSAKRETPPTGTSGRSAPAGAGAPAARGHPATRAEHTPCARTCGASSRRPGSTVVTTGVPVSRAARVTSTEMSLQNTSGAVRSIHPAIIAMR